MNENGIGDAVRRPMASLRIAASGLSAQRARVDVIAQNIANVETTRGLDGAPYRRKVLVMEEVPFQEALARQPATASGQPTGGVRVAGVEEDVSEGALVYDPGHPHADQRGYVRMPNVSITEEMAGLLESRRLFEANATVFEAVKTMLSRATRL